MFQLYFIYDILYLFLLQSRNYTKLIFILLHNHNIITAKLTVTRVLIVFSYIPLGSSCVKCGENFLSYV